MQILCLSNGHGEDAIALQVLAALQEEKPDLSLAALPIVGTGHAYQKLDIPIIGQTKQMPSGGFVYMDNRQMFRDIKGGLLQLTRQQYQAIRRWGQRHRREESLILAVGDIVPLLFARLSGCPYTFIGTAKSEYYLRDRQGRWLQSASRLDRWFGSVYLPWERWLLSSKRCLAVYPRDQLTTEVLRHYRIPAFSLGNPMMDGLLPTDFPEPTAPECLSIVLLPGSRTPEATHNWDYILTAVDALLNHYPQVRLMGAIAPSLSLKPFIEAASKHLWQQNEALNPEPELTLHDSEAQVFKQARATLTLTQHRYAECLQKADLAIAMAGTATEQFVGLGKPAFSIIGVGPQFNPQFAEAQTRLLGPSVILSDSPEQVSAKIQALLSNPDQLQGIANNGYARLGPPGAAMRIARHLLTLA